MRPSGALQNLKVEMLTGDEGIGGKLLDVRMEEAMQCGGGWWLSNGIEVEWDQGWVVPEE